MSRLDLEVLPISRVEAQAVARYRYPGARAYYNLADERGAVSYMLDARHGFHAVRDPRGLHGFCSFGADGRVPGGKYDEEALDVGAGMDPALVGKGQGRAFVEAVVQHAIRSLRARTLRVTIATWNEQALRVWRGAGFQPVSTFCSAAGDAFTILARACPHG